MRIGDAEIELVTEAIQALEGVDPGLAHALVDAFIDPYWENMEPLPPVYDGPYGPANPAPGNYGPEVAA